LSEGDQTRTVRVEVVKPKKVCKHCGSILKHEEYDLFCDYCQEKISREESLEITTFWKERDVSATSNEFCSWICAISWLKEFPYNMKEVQFISLPYITEAHEDFEKDFNEFFKALRAGVKKG